MYSLQKGILAVLVLAFAASAGAPPPGGTDPFENDCGDCYDEWSPEMCDLAGMLEDCHDWMYGGELPYGGGSCHEHLELGDTGLYFANLDCQQHQWCGNPACATEEEEALLGAVNQVSSATSVDEAHQAIDAFVDIPGIWIELNRNRVAVQVLSEGCRPGSAGTVLQHLPISGSMVQVWEAAFSVE